MANTRGPKAQFSEQGGAATMDPNAIRRWVVSKLLSSVLTERGLRTRREKLERRRLASGQGHCVEYFHQIDDPYSALMVQILDAFVSRYDIHLSIHLVEGPSGNNVSDLEQLLAYARRDAANIAGYYGLWFPAQAGPPDSALIDLAQRIVAAQPADRLLSTLRSVTQALWCAEASVLAELGKQLGAAGDASVQKVLRAGNGRRAELGHYSGAMVFYGGEWYWGLDRLCHLEARLLSVGADGAVGSPSLAPRPGLTFKPRPWARQLTLEIFPSLRSPYTALVFERAVALARTSGIHLKVRPVLPMVMRGVPATREKGFYIFSDVGREARIQSAAIGRFYDPIGEPVRRCYALYPWAESQGLGAELVASFLRHAFLLGVNTASTSALGRVVAAAGLDWQEAQSQATNEWQQVVEANRQIMYGSGLWGVPSFRLLDSSGDELLATWGQDRLWLVADYLDRYSGRDIQMESSAMKPERA